jgi:diacylglycerol kinase family enzyme
MDAPSPTASRRVAALTAAVAWSVATVILLGFGVRNFGGLVLGIAGVVATIGGAWRAIVWQGVARLLGAAVAVAGVVLLAISVVLVVDGQGAGAGLFALLVVCVGLGLGSGRYALRREIHEAVLDPTWHTGPPPQKPVLICNPKSGGGKVVEFDLVAKAEAMGVRTLLLEPGTDLRSLAEQAVAEGADCLGMAGGDGSQALVAEVAMGHDLPFVCVPAGTRNHLALDLSLDRNDPSLALEAFRSPIERRIDIGYVGDRIFVNNVSLGIYGEMVRDPDYRDDKLGTALTHLRELTEAGTEPYDLHFDDPSGADIEGALVIQVSNNPYELTRMNQFGQRHRMDTGRLGIVAIRGDRFVDPGPIITLAAAGQLARSPAVVAFTTDTFEVRSSDSSVWAGIDGETVELTPPLGFTIRPLALRLHVPLGNLRDAEERRARDVRLRKLVTVALGREAD